MTRISQRSSDWIAWFDATLDMLREHEKENDRARRTRSP